MTEFAPPAVAQASTSLLPPASSPSYGPPTFATTWKQSRLEGRDFAPQADGTLRCPAGSPLYPQERRPERDGTTLPSTEIGQAPSQPAGRRPTACNVPTGSAPAHSTSFSCRAGTLPTLLDPTSGSQCHCGWFAFRLHHPVRATGRFCRFPGLAEVLTPSTNTQPGWFFPRSKSPFRAGRHVSFSAPMCSFIAIYLFYLSCSQPSPIS